MARQFQDIAALLHGEVEDAARCLSPQRGIKAEDVASRSQLTEVQGKGSATIRKILRRQGQQLVANRTSVLVEDARPHRHRYDDSGALSALIDLHKRTDPFVLFKHASCS